MINLKYAVWNLLILTAAPCLQGCTFSMPQFDAAVNFAKTITDAEASSGKEAPAVWLASVGGRGALLSPYTASGLIVFANTDGDAIAFDGWTIRSVVGFGLKEPLSISGKSGVRTFTLAGQKTQTKCDDWNLERLIWSQTCSNGPSEIVLDDDGNIQKITMAIGNGSRIVTLRVAN